MPPRGPRVGFAEAPLPPQDRLGGRRREPAREIAILAIALGHPALLEAHWEEFATLEFAAPKLAAFRDALLATPPEALDTPEALAEALRAAGRGAERRAHSVRGGEDAGLVVPARRGRADRRRARSSAEPGLASAGGRVK